MSCFKPLFSLLFLTFSASAHACEPPVVYYETLTIRGGSARPEVNAFVGQNAPVIRDVTITRGTAAQSSLCGGNGYITLSLALPPGAPVTFDDVGFEFRVVEGKFHEFALPPGPIVSLLGPNEEFTHLGVWGDGPPPKHKTIDAVVEVFFVSPDGTTGPATRFSLYSEVNKSKEKEGKAR